MACFRPNRCTINSPVTLPQSIRNRMFNAGQTTKYGAFDLGDSTHLRPAGRAFFIMSAASRSIPLAYVIAPIPWNVRLQESPLAAADSLTARNNHFGTQDAGGSPEVSSRRCKTRASWVRRELARTGPHDSTVGANVPIVTQISPRPAALTRQGTHGESPNSA